MCIMVDVRLLTKTGFKTNIIDTCGGGIKNINKESYLGHTETKGYGSTIIR